jgi:aryl carrier-like protein
LAELSHLQPVRASEFKPRNTGQRRDNLLRLGPDIVRVMQVFERSRLELEAIRSADYGGVGS